MFLKENFCKSASKKENIMFSPEHKKIDSIQKDKDYSPFVIKSGCYSSFSNKINSLTERKKKKLSKEIFLPSPNSSKKNKLSDRFIPMNKGINLTEKFNMAAGMDSNSDENLNMENIEQSDQENNIKYNQILKQNFLNEKINTSFLFKSNSNSESENKPFTQKKFFSFKEETKPKNTLLENFINMDLENEENTFEEQRNLELKPYKTLKVPNIRDDFYLNLLDWSVKNDIALGIGDTVQLLNKNQTQKSVLCSYEDDNYASSLIFSNNGDQIAIGNSTGEIDIYDCKYFYLIF